MDPTYIVMNKQVLLKYILRLIHFSLMTYTQLHIPLINTYIVTHIHTHKFSQIRGFLENTRSITTPYDLTILICHLINFHANI